MNFLKNIQKKENNMEAKEKPIFYYIRGVEGRGEEVIKMFEKRWTPPLLTGDNPDKIYYIDEYDNISSASENEHCGNYYLIIKYGTELFLPEKNEEHQFKVRDEVLVRDDDDFFWIYAIFSHYRKDDVFTHVTCGGICYKQCIPFKGNEHLLGTNKDEDYGDK